MYEISDDDDSFTDPGCSKIRQNDTVLISSDDESAANQLDFDPSSEIEELPAVEIVQKNNAIKKLFSSNKDKNEKKNSAIKVLFPQNNITNDVLVSAPPKETPKPAVINRMIGGVNVMLPVNPYGSQIALMSKIIKGIKDSENCILESPTGSGKTLALLCGVLAWQQHEEGRIAQEQAKNQAQAYFQQYPEMQKENVTDFIASPLSKKIDVMPQELFSKISFGEKSIYQKPEEKEEASCSTNKRGPYRTSSVDDSPSGLVSIHKKRRQGSVERENLPPNAAEMVVTPKKSIPVEEKKTPEDIRKLYDLVNNLRVRTSMLVDCSLPTIYYGARTHTQLAQVIKEFRRTSYCGQAKMTLLSSRDKSCIREFSKEQWSSRNDMCRACVVKSLAQNLENKKSNDTNCKYYDNRRHLNHGAMPPAFDLEELVQIGQEKNACPYYGAREMAKTANIVFCPYNYLIDPSIRSNLQINLQGSIIVIDEAHNIESNCRDAASLSFTQTQIQSALKELEKVAEYRYANQDVLSYIDELVLTLKNWNDWFQNQLPLINEVSLNNNRAVHAWQTKHFVDTLENHNIGYSQFNTFKLNSDQFCRRLREDPRTLYGVSQATGTLLESLCIVLGYLFRDECKHMDDFKPSLERYVTGRTSAISANDSWRKSQFNQWVATDSLTLYLHCMNPAIVMSSLHVARCIILASGTLTPMGNLHAELGTDFPLRVSPNHIISNDRVWVAAVSGDSNGPQEYTSKGTKGLFAAERLGKLVTRVCQLTPHGVLCFVTSYAILDTFKNTWVETGLWSELTRLKYVFTERRNATDHEDMMKDFYECVATKKGALLFAVYRGKVSEGMDFKDHQARAVICVGIPYPNTFDTAVKAKMEYNDKYKTRGLLPEREWLRVQAYRALNQAVGRCVRHKNDWGAVLLVDARYTKEYFTEHLSKWVLKIMGNNHHSYESLQSSPNGLAAFMEKMKIIEEEDGFRT